MRISAWSSDVCSSDLRFHYVVFRNTADLLRQDRQNNFRTWRGLLAYLYGKPGLMRLLLRDLFTYFRPNFHPWQHDDRALARSEERRVWTEWVSSASFGGRVII